MRSKTRYTTHDGVSLTVLCERNSLNEPAVWTVTLANGYERVFTGRWGRSDMKAWLNDLIPDWLYHVEILED